MTADRNLWDNPAILAEIGRQVIALVEKIKEKGEREKRKPPTPPKEKSQRDQEKATTATTRVRVREDGFKGPTPEECAKFARKEATA